MELISSEENIRLAYRSIKRNSGSHTSGTDKLNIKDMFHNVRIDISRQIKPAFEILPKRWRVERTLSWFGGYRRLSKDFEYSALSEENLIYIAHLHLLLKRL